MKVALVHNSAPPVVGGVESVMASHANLLADAGHQVQVIAGRGAQWRADIPVVVLPLADSRAPQILALKRQLDQGIVPHEFAELAAQLRADLQQHLADADIIIAHNVASLNKNLPLAAALHEISQTPQAPATILWHHDLAWTTPRYRAELHNGEPWSLLRTAWPGATQVVVSRLRQHELAKLMAIPLESVHVVPNGVDLAAFFKLEPWTERLIADLDLLKADPLLLLPVRLTPRKNVELALRTVAEVRHRLPHVRLVISGPIGTHNPANVDYFATLRALRDDLKLGEQVTFLAEVSDEFLPDAVIADLYRLADALLFPSREEGFGIPMLEAGLSNLPIFAADIEPLRELGEENVAWFSPDAPPAQVAKLIADYLADSSVRKMKARAREYTWSAIYAQIIAPLLETARFGQHLVASQ